MLRSALIALLVLGLTLINAEAAKPKKPKVTASNWSPGTHKTKNGTSYHGTFVSFKNGSLTINISKKKKSFKVPNGTPVYVFHQGKKSHTEAQVPSGLTGVKGGTKVNVGVLKGGKVEGVAVLLP
jgi:hypothetical protein